MVSDFITKSFCSSYVGITSCADFSWLSRLRYYWVGGDESETSDSSQSQKQDTTADEDSLAIGSNVELQMLHSKYELIHAHLTKLNCGKHANEFSLNTLFFLQRVIYGYEYLNAFTRLVMTPQTERCYRILLMALDLHQVCEKE